jgi:hypothetical protein
MIYPGNAPLRAFRNTPLVQSFFERHADKIDRNNPRGCWNWIAAKSGAGYGVVKVNGKTAYVHRMVVELTGGPIPANLCVRHKCDNPACCFPGHLDLGTQADNNRDCRERGRHGYKLPLMKGEQKNQAKLTEAKVAAIRSEYVCGSRTNGTRALARRFGVAQSLISMVVSRERWVHVLNKEEIAA